MPPKLSIPPLACNSPFFLGALINTDEHINIANKVSKVAFEHCTEELIPLYCNLSHLFACEEDGIECSSEGAYANVEAKFFTDLFLKFTKEKCAIIIELSLNESNGIS